MICRPLLLVLACTGYLLLSQTLLPRTAALRITPNVADEFVAENHRIRRKDYRNQRVFDEGLLTNMDNLAELLPIVREADSEGQSSHDMRNDMIRKDAYFLDNSIETRERGSLRKKSFSSRAPSCNCESTRETILLGEDYFPIRLESRKCLGNCAPPYQCKAVYYWVPVLKKMKPHHSRISALEVPDEIPPGGWESQRVNVTTSCVCTAEYTDPNF
ncbi:hypothetical protein NE865_03996 [Phthorimaea operculella]|nr:hypothetical protein NE865_03996 [Phthorimaea operculella]